MPQMYMKSVYNMAIAAVTGDNLLGEHCCNATTIVAQLCSCMFDRIMTCLGGVIERIRHYTQQCRYGTEVSKGC